MIKDELDITISYYMCAKLVHIIHSNATQQHHAELDMLPKELLAPEIRTQSSGLEQSVLNESFDLRMQDSSAACETTNVEDCEFLSE